MAENRQLNAGVAPDVNGNEDAENSSRPKSAGRPPKVPRAENSEMAPSGGQRTLITRLRGFVVTGAVLSLIWWILTGGVAYSWLVGVPAVLLSTVLSVALQSPSPGHFRLSALVAFIPYFLMHSLRGGLDVAWRSCDPRLPIAPAMCKYSFRLPDHDSSRAFFAGTLNLLPGTLTAEMHDDHLVVHLLTTGHDIIPRLVRLEERVGRLFGHRLSEATRRIDIDSVS
jgi:multicomponent Na+:H+ antiporter subunit E